MQKERNIILSLNRLLVFIILILPICQGFGQVALADSLRSILERDSSNTNILMQLAKIIRNQDPAQAESLVMKALRIARSKKTYGGLDSALYEVASVNYIQGKLEPAIECLRERVKLETKQRDTVALVKSYNFLAGLLNEKGDKVEALDIYLQAKAIVDKLPDLKLKYSINYNLGLYYHEEREKALRYRLEAYELSKQITDFPQAYRRNAEITSVLANEYYLMNDFKTARKFLREALTNATEGNFPSREAYAYSIYSDIFRTEKNYDSAVFYGLKSIKLKTTIGERNRLHDSYGMLGEVYLEMKNYQEAIKNLEEAVKISREMKSLFFQYRWLPTLARAYAGSGNHQLAYKTMAEYYALTDSVMNEEKVKAIAELEAKYESEKKEQEIKSLKRDQAWQAKVNRSQIIIFVAIVLLLVISGLAYYFRAKAKEQENIRLTDKVDAQNRELSTISLLVNKKNEALMGLKEKIANNGNGDGLKSIIKDIEREIDFDAEWDTFKYHFEKVHQDFFSRLTEVAPSLTNKEQRYCSYFKSNLSTKEIAQLTNTSVRGVQQARYRINQKFAEVNTSLSEFLQKS